MKKSSFIISLVFIALLTACSDDKSMLDYVSADHDFVMSVSPAKILDNTGCKITSDGVEFSPEMEVFVNKGEGKVLKEICQQRAISPDKIIIIGDINERTSDQDIYMIAEISDKGALEKLFADKGAVKAAEESGMTVYEADNVRLVVDGDILVFTDFATHEAVKNITALKKAAEKKPLPKDLADKLADSDHAMVALGHLDKLTSVFAKQNPMVTAAAMSGVSKTLTTVLTCDLKGGKASMDIEFYDADGKKIENDILDTKPDTSLLKYTTSYDRCVMLIANPLKGKLDSKDQNEKLAGVPFNQIAALFNDVSDIMIAGGPVDASAFPAPGSMSLVVALKATQGKGINYFNLLKENASKESDFNDAGDSGFTFTFNRNKCFCRLDGDVVVASLGAPVTAAGMSPVKAKDFGKGMVQVIADIPDPAKGENLLNLPYGIDFDLKVDKEGFESDLEFPGSNMPFLQTMLSLLQK